MITGSRTSATVDFFLNEPWLSTVPELLDAFLKLWPRDVVGVHEPREQWNIVVFRHWQDVSQLILHQFQTVPELRGRCFKILDYVWLRVHEPRELLNDIENDWIQNSIFAISWTCCCFFSPKAYGYAVTVTVGSTCLSRTRNLVNAWTVNHGHRAWSKWLVM